MRFGWVALLLALFVFGLHGPIVASGALLGAPKTDVLRAVWGFDHVARGFPFPFWTDRIDFPVGVKVLVLPFVSSLAGAPLHWVFGAVRGYDLWVLGLVWLTGVATAFWVRTVSGSEAAGFAAGAAMVSQPAMLLALTDGTPEHVAFWAVPALLTTLVLARGQAPKLWGVLAGVFATAVAFDSPYHAVFVLPMVLVLLPRLPRPALWRFVGVSAVGVALIAAMYYGFPLAGPLDDRARNAVKLNVWWEWESGRRQTAWDYTYTPAFLPGYSLAAAGLLALLRPVRSGVWVGLTVLCLGLSLSNAAENTHALAAWLGSPGQALGDGLSWFNSHLAPGLIRFPRRWLVPACLAAWTAAGIGLSRLPKEWMRALVALPVGLGVVKLTLDETRYAEALPAFVPPDPAFARFIREHEGDGYALLLPRVRGASRLHERFELPVYADLDPSLTSADLYWLQVAVGRGVVNSPDGLFTLTPRTSPGEELGKLLRDLDDLAKPQTTGDPIPPSATQEPDRRAAEGALLVKSGLRYVAIDEAVMADAGLAGVKAAFDGCVVEEQHFDDGTGVTVLVLAPKD